MNNPLSGTDPSGYASDGETGAAGGAFFAAHTGLHTEELTISIAKTMAATGRPGKANIVLAALGDEKSVLDTLNDFAIGGGKRGKGPRKRSNQRQQTNGKDERVKSAVDRHPDETGSRKSTEKTKTYTGYDKAAPNNDGPAYAGITSGTGTPEQQVAKRERGHKKLNALGYGPAELTDNSNNPDVTRGREQDKIDMRGGAKSQGGTSANQNNSVSPRNKKRDQYLGASAEADAEDNPGQASNSTRAAAARDARNGGQGEATRRAPRTKKK
jgi:hypothetical protein